MLHKALLCPLPLEAPRQILTALALPRISLNWVTVYLRRRGTPFSAVCLHTAEEEILQVVKIRTSVGICQTHWHKCSTTLWS